MINLEISINSASTMSKQEAFHFFNDISNMIGALGDPKASLTFVLNDGEVIMGAHQGVAK